VADVRVAEALRLALLGRRLLVGATVPSLLLVVGSAARLSLESMQITEELLLRVSQLRLITVPFERSYRAVLGNLFRLRLGVHSVVVLLPSPTVPAPRVALWGWELLRRWATLTRGKLVVDIGLW